MPHTITCPVCQGKSHGDECARCEGLHEVTVITSRDYTHLMMRCVVVHLALKDYADTCEELGWDTSAAKAKEMAETYRKEAAGYEFQAKELFEQNI